MNTIRPSLPPMPAKMTALPIDERGYPVPYFVAWIDGKPDHRVMDSTKLPSAIKGQLCWMCGQKLGAFKSFVIGPMCSITKTISEPPSHLECARFAAIACPFMMRPMAKRRTAGLPEDAIEPAGEGLKRNPGAVCVWTTRTFKPFRPPGGGVLFRLGDPEHTEWYAEGRSATRAEIDYSISTGIHNLEESATAQGPNAVAALNEERARVTAMLDKQFGAGVEA